ncbi:hypothetical protein YC2023_101005 [Brassica napus]
MAGDLDKPLLDPDTFNREGVDLGLLPLEEVFEHLRTTPRGLLSEEAEERLKIFGLNRLEEKQENKFLKFLGFMWNPLSWVMEAAALIAIALANSEVLRDGQWQEQDASILVPGDIISIKLGDIIPADSRLLDGDPLKIDQSVLTGESVPVTKKKGEQVFSGSTCKQGEIEAVVIATGSSTFFGKTACLVDSTDVTGHLQQVLTSIGNFCICSIAVGMVLEIIVMFPIQHRPYRVGINNLLVLLIGGIPIAMPTVLSVTLAIGSHRLSQQGAITKRMTAIEEMAGMDVLCCDKTGTLTLNSLSVDRNLIEVFADYMNKDTVLLLAGRASRLENQDAIDTAIVSMLADPREARANIKEVHFLPFNPVDKRTAITYIDSDGKWYRATKGAPEQEIPERSSNNPGGPWKFCGLLPLFDPPRHDSGETILRALNLGVCVKMITGDQLAIAKETGRRLGMGTNMYPSSSLLGHNNNDEHEAIPVDELIEMADGFAGVFPEHKYEIVKILQEKKHVVGMTGDGVNDAPALKKADIGIAVADATDAAISSADIVLTEPGLSVIISAVLTSRAIFQRMKNYTLGFTLLALIWEYDFPPFMVLIIAILNDGTIMTISKDRVRPSPTPESWKLNQIFATGIVIGTYLALVTVLFYWLIVSTTFFEKHFHVKSIAKNTEQVSSAVYLQVSIISQALIFVTRSRSWSFLERPGTLLIFAFLVAQLAATLIAVYAKISFANITGIGWGWAGVIWLYSLIFYVPLDVIKFVFNYALSGDAWNLVLDRKTAFTYKKDDGTANVTITQRSHSAEELGGSRSRPSWIAEQTRRRAEIARLVEGHSVSRHLESVIKLKQIDSKMIRAAHTV